MELPPGYLRDALPEIRRGASAKKIPEILKETLYFWENLCYNTTAGYGQR